MSTIPEGAEAGGLPAEPVGKTRKSNRGRIFAVVGAVVALLTAAVIGRASASPQQVQPAAAPAPVTVTAKPSTVTKTVTATPAPVTVTADPITVTAPPATVTATVTAEGPTVTAEAPSAPKAGIRDGINLVGTDVQPGTFRSDKADCYWARLSGTSGSFDDIIANSIGATVVTVSPSDVALESRGCAPWTQVG